MIERSFEEIVKVFVERRLIGIMEAHTRKIIAVNMPMSLRCVRSSRKKLPAKP